LLLQDNASACCSTKIQLNKILKGGRFTSKKKFLTITESFRLRFS
jgi:hypothetical protein